MSHSDHVSFRPCLIQTHLQGTSKRRVALSHLPPPTPLPRFPFHPRPLPPFSLPTPHPSPLLSSTPPLPSSAVHRPTNLLSASFPTPSFSLLLPPSSPSHTYNIYMSLLNLTVTANDNSTVGIKQMCAQPVKNGGCVYYSPLAYWKDDRALMLSRTDAQLHADVDELLLSGLIPVQQRQVLGCLVKTPSKVYAGNYDVESVGALIFT
ncbi:unnamed protein product, partial [Closterium sp. NIES-54]